MKGLSSKDESCYIFTHSGVVMYVHVHVHSIKKNAIRPNYATANKS